MSDSELYNHGQTCRLTGVNSPQLTMWTVCSEKMPGMSPRKLERGSYWYDLPAVKLLACVNALHDLGLTVKRSVKTALSWSHMGDAETDAGTLVSVRPPGGVHANALTLCVTRPGQEFGDVIAIDPGAPFISQWKKLIGDCEAVTILDCDRVLGAVTERLNNE